MPTPPSARFFDGKSLQPYDAGVIVEDQSITITYPQNGQDVVLHWPAKQLQIMEQLSERPAVIAHRELIGARLIISDSALYQAILPLVPKKQIKVAGLSHSWRWMVWLFIISIALLGLALWGVQQSAPLLARHIPENWDNKLGQRLIRAFAAGHEECVAPQGKAALNVMITKLTAPLTLQKPFKVKVLKFNKKDINAFSVSGNYIIIMSGLIDFADNADELAGVLAHEMGHAIEHHPTQSLLRQLGIKIMMTAAFGSSMDFGTKLLILKHSRDDEYQADDIGVKILSQANISPQGLSHFLEKMQQKSLHLPLQEFWLDYFNTHPALEDRIQRIKVVKINPQTQPALTAQQWQDLKNICQETAPLSLQK